MDSQLCAYWNQTELMSSTASVSLTFVTGFWKNLPVIGFFLMKIELDVSLISSTLELTHLQV